MDEAVILSSENHPGVPQERVQHIMLNYRSQYYSKSGRSQVLGSVSDGITTRTRDDHLTQTAGNAASLARRTPASIGSGIRVIRVIRGQKK